MAGRRTVTLATRSDEQYAVFSTILRPLFHERESFENDNATMYVNAVIEFECRDDVKEVTLVFDEEVLDNILRSPTHPRHILFTILVAMDEMGPDT